MIDRLKLDLKNVSSQKRGYDIARYFKTSKGQYGEGDIFVGVSMPDQRIIAKKYYDLSFIDIGKLLQSKIHEERLIGLLILVERFKKGNEKIRKKIFNFYVTHRDRVNNWDLVDVSAYQIVGEYLLDKPRKILYTLAKSKILWDKRIAIVSTFSFIRKNEYKDTLAISELLLKESHDLIHKAAGWMLREVGKKEEKILCTFLDKHHKIMPRTMLRYAIEKFDKEKRIKYMKK